MNPLVTILSPCYNVEPFLPKYFETVLGQTYTNLQVVLIDDGSKDNTWQVMQEYAAKDSRIEIYHQHNQGVASTRNNLLDKVKGEYVLFVDSDDWIELDMVHKLLDKATETDAKIVTCLSTESSNNLPFAEQKWSQEKAILEFLRHVIFSGSLWNKLIDVSVIKDIRFNTAISYGEDALFCWHILQNVNFITVTNMKLYHYRRNESGLSLQNWTPSKKGSGSITWKVISDETKQLWPKYSDIAIARYAIEDMWGLYYASLANYPYDEHIKIRQKNIQENFDLIKSSGLINRKKLFTAFILSHFYWLGRFIKYTR